MNNLDELDRLHAAATAGEWESVLCDAPHVNDGVRMVEGPVTRANGKKFVPVISRISPRADADFIAAAHNAWPEFSARLRAAEAALREMLKAFDGAHDLDCNASGAPDAEVCKCEDGCAEPHCECGATRARGIARAALGEP